MYQLFCKELFANCKSNIHTNTFNNIGGLKNIGALEPRPFERDGA